MLRNVTRFALALCALGARAGTGEAAEIRGTLSVADEIRDLDAVAPIPGYVRIQVTEPAPGITRRPVDLAVFLQVEDSLPLPDPSTTPEIHVFGFRFSPAIVSCPVDAPVAFVNDGTRPVTLEIGGRPLGEVQPGAREEWVCAAGPDGAILEPVVAVGQPFMGASVYVGEVGVAALPDASGRFRLTAPAGTYRLLVVGRDGVRFDQPIEVGDRDIVDLGTLALEDASP